MSTREEQEVTDPDLSSEVVFCLGDDLVVTDSYGGGGVPLMARPRFSFSEERLDCEADGAPTVSVLAPRALKIKNVKMLLFTSLH